MSKVQGALALALAALATLSSCVKSDLASCIAGFALCGGVCVETAVDPRNCGACGNVCSPSQDCVGGGCTTTCESMLHAPIRDSWGAVWDGIERPYASFQAARAACVAIGGRLPSVSELYRVSARKSGEVGDASMLHGLWSLTPFDGSNAYAVALANATSSGGGVFPVLFDDPHVAYRCVCPPPRPAAFTEGACFGPAGAGCVPLGGNARFNFDREDRPYLGKAGAAFECALAGGELASVERLGAAVAQGLPNGTDELLHTADDLGLFVLQDTYYYEDDALLQFTGSTWNVTSGTSGATNVSRPFRCFGPATTAAVPATVPGGFRDRRGGRTIDLGPDFAATTYSSAVADCFRRGGHLATATELLQFVLEGLPAFGYADGRWTADLGYPGYAVTFAWSGTSAWPDAALAVTAPTRDGVPYAWGSSVSHEPLSSVAGLPYRCVYYAVDPTQVAPAESLCSSGCFQVSPGAATASPRPRLWFDQSSRTAASYSAAVAACAAAGGRMASARDLLEAIRAGLDNPGGDAAATSELTGLAARTIAWTGSVNPTFVDVAASSADLTSSMHFRCMWTDEVR